ncbi:MAG: putative CocE/NonD family hydrolase [Chlamydiales bacterium]|jgi:putative CocE/NonD family hydrolase
MIPMRDGAKLYTVIYSPLGIDEPCPILMTRTPYGIAPPFAVKARSTYGPSSAFATAGYIFVHQDVRGQFKSEGEWEILMPPRTDPSDPLATDEITDVHDTIDWLLANVEGQNGRVGMWGVSYDAWETAMAMSDAHPALLAVSPQASPGNDFIGDDTHHNGAFRLTYSYAWVAFMAAERGDIDRRVIGPTLTQDAYEFFRGAGSLPEIEERYFGGKVPEWTDIIEHPNYDEYWDDRNVLNYLGDVRPAVLNVAGWFDAEDFRGPIDIYHEVERTDDDDNNLLVVGPWKHGGWHGGTGDSGQSLGDLDFGEPTAEWYREVIELPFFEHHLRGGEDPLLPEAFAFETGGNVWRELDSWPPASAQARALYLHKGGVASFDAPTTEESFSGFESDPAFPVPYTRQGPVFPNPEYMVEDQRFLADRDDVLTFVTEPLKEDLVIAGRPEVELHFSTTGTDADWVIKLIDVYPEDTEEVSPATGKSLAGAQPILSGEIFRARYRDSFEEPTALEPGQLTELNFVLPDRLHRFRAGHRIMVQAHCTWFPMYDRNPQVFSDIYLASEEDFQPADQRVFHERGAASLVKLPVFSD